MVESPVAILLCWLAFFLGVFFGTRSERKGWTMRANGNAHNVGGKFYYIETEKHRYPDSGRSDA